jgi:hypothetical protein
MADEQQGGEEKSLEMRLSEIEDKLAQMHVTEDELKAFQKVSRLQGLSGPGAGGSVSAGCILDCSGGCINECLIRACIVQQCGIIRACTIIRNCWECFECGGWRSGGGFGGGFGTLGG